MYTYKYRWQTNESPARPQYSGVDTVRMNEDNDVKAREKCIRQVAERMCLPPGSIRIVSRNIKVETDPARPGMRLLENED